MTQKTKQIDSIRTTAVNQGLRAYMLRVYQLMAGGLAVSGLAAWFGSQPVFLRLLYNIDPAAHAMSLSLFGWIVILAPLVLVFMFASAVSNLNPTKAQTIFWIFSVLMGLSMSSIFLIYATTSIAQVFLITAGTFAGMSLWGYTTKRDLTQMGSFLMMGLIGLILAMLVNWLMKSPALAYAISIIGVVIFVGLTAYDTQKIRMMYNETDDENMQKSKAISGALSLYLDFINLFLMLLRLMGDRR